MTLDQRADAATRELLVSTQVDVERGLVELRATRRRRDTGRRTAVALVVAALASATAWMALHTDDQSIEPAPAPGSVSNGALVGLDVDARIGGFRALQGKAPAHLPDLYNNREGLQFTSDGTHAVYVDIRDRALLLDLADGSSRVIGTCPGGMCAPALSPDGTTLAWSGAAGPRLQEVGRDEVDTVPLPVDVRGTGWPTWSPDGSSIAFYSSDGVYVVRPDGSDLRLVRPLPERASAWQPVSFSPDGSRLAFIEGLPRPESENGEYDWTVVVVDLADGSARRVYDAGHCACVGLPPPSLAWSPDGSQLAVATSQGTVQGVHVIRPDGSDDRLVEAGAFSVVAWQPLVG